jgi:hypothetical protein
MRAPPSSRASVAVQEISRPGRSAITSQTYFRIIWSREEVNFTETHTGTARNHRHTYMHAKRHAGTVADFAGSPLRERHDCIKTPQSFVAHSSSKQVHIHSTCSLCSVLKPAICLKRCVISPIPPTLHLGNSTVIFSRSNQPAV